MITAQRFSYVIDLYGFFPTAHSCRDKLAGRHPDWFKNRLIQCG
ncbi:hypothetical protein CAter282_1055 [Collimonas arenae]|uniref:Uncharacterized protein n=1 Tax=Collimonas arenae TaxID=279058 RepID=A0A127QFM1_9BURK|nr:hypothetical protein CAter282_1055 [Collimonas arenae]